MKSLLIDSQKQTARHYSQKIFKIFDLKLLFTVLALILIGLISIYSATYEVGNKTFFYRQLVYSFIGLAIMIIIVFLPEKFLKIYSIFTFILAIIFLIAVLIFGKTVSGTKGWLIIAGISFQPAEFAKIATLLTVASFLSRKGIDIHNIRDFFKVLLIFSLPLILILLQPDVGSATVFLVTFIGILFWMGFDLYILYFLLFIPIILIISLIGTWYFISAFIFFVITSIFFKRKLITTITLIIFILIVGFFSQNLFKLMPHNTQDRIETFLYPNKDPLKKGYNVMQALLAVGSGGITGKGFLQGSQTQLRYIPEQRTDFIYCVTTEEFGFIGGALVIILYAYLIKRMLAIASETRSDFLNIISFSIAIIYFYHVTINLGMVLRLLPVMGIPLPLMSYGGTALIMNLAMIGLLLNAYRQKRLSY